MGEDKGHHLLVATTMGTQAAFNGFQVVVFRGAAQDDIASRNHNDIAETVGGQLELFRGVASIYFGYSGKIIKEVEDVKFASSGDLWRQMHNGKRTQRAVMGDIGISDGQDDAKAGAVFLCQLAFEVNSVGRAVGFLLCVHAVIGGDADESAEFSEVAKLHVDGGV